MRITQGYVSVVFDTIPYRAQRPPVAVFDMPNCSDRSMRCNLRIYGHDDQGIDLFAEDRETLAEILEWLAGQARAAVNEAAA